MGVKVLQAYSLGDPIAINAISRLLKTGQTTDLSVAGRTSQDDGALQLGVATVYETLSTGQYSGTTNITVNAKTDVHSNNVVIDKSTGLMWMNAYSDSVGPLSDGALYFDDTAGSDEDVFNYCDAANTASLAGHTDWRVPNVRELLSIWSYDDSNVTRPPAAYWATWVVTVHTSTSRAENTANSTRVSASGLFVNASKTATSANAILCRGM